MCNLQRIFCVMAVVAMVSSSPLETTLETNQEPMFSTPETTETIFSGPETHLVGFKATFPSIEAHLSDVETTSSGPQIHLSDLETTSVTPGLPADAPAAHIAARTHTSGEAHTPHDLPSARGRQPSVSQTGARVSERVARTKRGSGVVIRGPFYPYPQGRGYLRFTSGAGHSQGRASYLLLLAGITFVYSSWRRWA